MAASPAAYPLRWRAPRRCSGFNASQYHLFADHLHPGPSQVHTHIIAQYIQSIIAAPVIGDIPGTKAFSRWAQVQSHHTLDSRYQQLFARGKLLSWFTGHVRRIQREYQRYDNNEADGDPGNHNNLTVGAHYQLNEQVFAGEG